MPVVPRAIPAHVAVKYGNLPSDDDLTSSNTEPAPMAERSDA